MATEITTRERVQQAVNRQFELLADKEAAGKVEDAARSARNTAKSSDVVDKAEKKASKVLQGVQETAEGEYQKTVTSISRLLQKAQDVFNAADGVAQSIRDILITKAEKAHQTAVSKAQQEYDMGIATTEADVHRAQREVDAIKATIDQNRQVVKESLGIDLSNLLV